MCRIQSLKDQRRETNIAFLEVRLLIKFFWVFFFFYIGIKKAKQLFFNRYTVTKETNLRFTQEKSPELQMQSEV